VLARGLPCLHVVPTLGTTSSYLEDQPAARPANESAYDARRSDQRPRPELFILIKPPDAESGSARASDDANDCASQHVGTSSRDRFLAVRVWSGNQLNRFVHGVRASCLLDAREICGRLAKCPSRYRASVPTTSDVERGDCNGLGLTTRAYDGQSKQESQRVPQ
jgi:hypothetical protein